MDPTERLKQRRWSRYAGVTLTEAIVASTLLLVSIIPLLKALTATHGMDRAIERKSWSLLLAQQELERIRARSLYHYDDSFQVNSRSLGDGFLGTVADDRHPMLRTVTVTVGLDRNGDETLGADEVEVRLCTSLARRWPGRGDDRAGAAPGARRKLWGTDRAAPTNAQPAGETAP